MDWNIDWNIKRVWLDDVKEYFTYYQIFVRCWLSSLFTTTRKINNQFLFETYTGNIYIEDNEKISSLKAWISDIQVFNPKAGVECTINDFKCFDGMNQQLFCMKKGTPITGQYSLRIKIDGKENKLLSYYNQQEHISLPEIMYPENNAVLKKGNINFQWSKIPDVFYGIEVCKPSNERIIFLTYVDITSFQYNINEPGKYKWRVMVFDTDDIFLVDNCSYSSWYEFEIF